MIVLARPLFLLLYVFHSISEFVFLSLYFSIYMCVFIFLHLYLCMVNFFPHWPERRLLIGHCACPATRNCLFTEKSYFFSRRNLITAHIFSQLSHNKAGWWPQIFPEMFLWIFHAVIICIFRVDHQRLQSDLIWTSLLCNKPRATDRRCDFQKVRYWFFTKDSTFPHWEWSR